MTSYISAAKAIKAAQGAKQAATTPAIGVATVAATTPAAAPAAAPAGGQAKSAVAESKSIVGCGGIEIAGMCFTNTQLMIGGGVIALIIILGLFFLLRKKSPSKAYPTRGYQSRYAPQYRQRYAPQYRQYGRR